MRVVIRADAGLVQGSGHVMRCLTLGEELLSRGHEVVLVTAPSAIGWLDEVIRASGIAVEYVEADSLDFQILRSHHPDWVVVDSYRIPSALVSALASEVRVLAIIDGDFRGIEATSYLEQNLGSEADGWPDRIRDRLLAGSRYSLIRRQILVGRQSEPWRIDTVPSVVAFMGGTDPTDLIVPVAVSLARVAGIALTVIAPLRSIDSVETALAQTVGRCAASISVVPATSKLPHILASANVVVSAAGTSAWDVCSLGIPSVLIGLVDNQSESLARVVKADAALGIDVHKDGLQALEQLHEQVEQLIGDEALRKRLSSRCAELFDGLGTSRVADYLELILGSSLARAELDQGRE